MMSYSVEPPAPPWRLLRPAELLLLLRAVSVGVAPPDDNEIPAALVNIGWCTYYSYLSIQLDSLYLTD